jgi:hypothetical protein
MRSVLLVAAALVAVPASAANLLSNGGFETGDLTGWTFNALAGSSGTGTVIANGAAAPNSGNPTSVNAGGGNWVYATGQNGPGTYELKQAFTLAVGGSITIKFDHFADDYSGTVIVDPIGLDHTGPANQHARVDLLLGSAADFSTAAGDVIANYYLGADATAAPSPWTSYSFTTTLAAGTYFIRFGQTDNQFFFTQGVDNVSVVSGAIPEPATWAMLIAGFGLVGGALRRRATAKVSA